MFIVSINVIKHKLINKKKLFTILLLNRTKALELYKFIVKNVNLGVLNFKRAKVAKKEQTNS